jgi:hypothetical protein
MSVEAENDSPKDWAGFNFSAVAIKESYFERDHRGDMYRFYRWFQWRASEIKSKWPDAKLPEVGDEGAADEAEPDKRFDIIYAIYMRPDKVGRYNGGVSLRRIARSDASTSSRPPRGNRRGGRVLRDARVPLPVGEDLGLRMGSRSWDDYGPTVKYINFWLEMEDMAVRKLLDPPSLTTERGSSGTSTSRLAGSPWCARWTR